MIIKKKHAFACFEKALAKITQKAGLKNDICRSFGSMREHKKHPVGRLCFSPDYVRKIVAVLKRGSSVFLFKSRMCCKKKRAFSLWILCDFCENLLKIWKNWKFWRFSKAECEFFWWILMIGSRKCCFHWYLIEKALCVLKKWGEVR